VDELTVHIDGRVTDITAEAIDEVIWLDAPSFAHAVGAEFKKLEHGPWAVCRGDLCIALEASDLRLQGPYMALAAIAKPLQLKWELALQTLEVTGETSAEQGTGFGHIPPAFSLPDLHTGELVSSSSFSGRKTFFYMWASW
jgi:hypothetical protein|tara:strand:- start:195 stop:617 length:423 start_codon:yes stop_codon:yes gene_type:complete